MFLVEYSEENSKIAYFGSFSSRFWKMVDRPQANGFMQSNLILGDNLNPMNTALNISSTVAHSTGY